MLKFGQVIDLEKLERMSSTKGTDEIRERLAKEDRRQIEEMERMEVPACIATF